MARGAPSRVSACATSLVSISSTSSRTICDRSVRAAQQHRYASPPHCRRRASAPTIAATTMAAAAVVCCCCLLLPAVAACRRCLPPLPAAAVCRCLPLSATACRCLPPLPAAAACRRCLPAAACRCLPLPAAAACRRCLPATLLAPPFSPFAGAAMAACQKEIEPWLCRCLARARGARRRPPSSPPSPLAHLRGGIAGGCAVRCCPCSLSL